MDCAKKGYNYIIESYQTLKNGFEWKTTMHIPFQAISPNPLTPNFIRMKVKDEERFVFLELEVHKEMTSQIIELLKDPRGFSHWFFEGPQGIGKSFTLLHLVIALRRFWNNKFRVIYVNNPTYWKTRSWSYIINEVIYAFAEDEEQFSALSTTITKFTLEQWYERLSKAEIRDRKVILQEFLETAQKYCARQGLKLLALLDQENEIGDMMEQEDYEFPFCCYNNIPGADYLITCASANNWWMVKKTQSFQDLRRRIKIPFVKFAFPENFILDSLKEYFRTNDLSFNPKYEKILQLAGSNPEEIFLIAQSCVEQAEEPNVDKIIKEYYIERLQELNNIHQKFIHENFKNNASRQKLFLEALTYMDTDFELPLNLQTIYDKRLMYIEGQRVLSLFPIARKVLLANLDDCSDVVENMVRNCLSLKVTGSGHSIEFYIIHTMKQLCKNHQTLFLELRNIHEPHSQVYEYRVKKIEDLIDIPLEKPSVTTLYVPINPRYPAIDCAIYDAKSDLLFPIQITLNQINHKDSYQEWQDKYQEGWRKVFNCDSRFVWLAGIVKNKTKKRDHQYFVADFQSLSTQNKGCLKIFNELVKELDDKAQNYSDGSMITEDDNE